MAIYIKGVAKPKRCEECPFTYVDDEHDYKPFDEYCYFTDKIISYGIDENCPLTEVPEPHGRLIDADVLLEESKKDGAFNYVDSWQIADAPTVIEGSE